MVGQIQQQPQTRPIVQKSVSVQQPVQPVIQQPVDPKSIVTDLSQIPKKKSNWWIWVLVILISISLGILIGKFLWAGL